MQPVTNNEKPVVYENTFRKLQQKAKELLSLENLNSSETSSVSDLNVIAQATQSSANDESLQKMSGNVKPDSPEVLKKGVFKSLKNNEPTHKEYKDKNKIATKKKKQKNSLPKTKSIKQKPQFTNERYLQ